MVRLPFVVPCSLLIVSVVFRKHLHALLPSHSAIAPALALDIKMRPQPLSPRGSTPPSTTPVQFTPAPAPAHLSRILQRRSVSHRRLTVELLFTTISRDSPVADLPACSLSKHNQSFCRCNVKRRLINRARAVASVRV